MIDKSASSIIRFSLKGADNIPDETMDSFEDQLIVGLKKNDVVSRYAGSFFVLLNGLTGENAKNTAAQLVETWNKPENATDIQPAFEIKRIGSLL